MDVWGVCAKVRRMSLVKKVVVRSPNWIGDHVMAYDAYVALRDLFPSAELTLLCPDSVSGLPFSELFSNQISFVRRKTLGEAFRLSREIKKHTFDLAVILASSPRTTLPFALARVPRRIGFDTGGASAWFLTESIGWKGAGSGEHKSQLYFELVEKLAAKSLIRKTRPLEPVPPEREDSIVIAPGASIELREWPHFLEIIQTLRKDFPSYRVTLVGGKSDRDWSEKLAPVLKNGVENKIGETSLADLTEICRRAKLVLVNDSGIAHVSGTLAQAPTLVLFGPGNPDYIRPLGPRVYDCRIELACSPCDKSYCRAPYGYQRCLIDLSAPHVMIRIRQILG